MKSSNAFTVRKLHRVIRRRRGSFERLEDRRLMAADFDSAFSVGGPNSELVYDLALDGAGNTCVVGRFTGTVDFDSGPGTYELTSTPSTTGNTFAAKYDGGGNLLWAQVVGPINSWFNFGPEIAAGADGSVYVVGTFEGTVTFGADTLTSAGSHDAYVVKLGSAGDFVWAKRFGGANQDWGNDVKVDAAGNVYLMAETRDLGNPDAFIAKLDSSGNTLWSTEIGATTSSTTGKKGTTVNGWVRGFKIAVDSAGAVYATGRMDGTVDFDASAGTTKLTGDAFVMKLSTSGSLVWARETLEGSNSSSIGWSEPRDIAVDASGNVYTTGDYGGRLDFDPRYDSRSKKYIPGWDLDTAGGSYVAAYNPSGTFLWARSTQSGVEAMALDGAGGIYLSGSFSGTTDFDPGAGTVNLTAAGGEDAFVLKLQTSGNFVWAGAMGGTGADISQGIGVDASGNIYVAGNFSGTADFDPGVGTFNLTTSGSADLFVVKLSQTSVMAAAAEGQSSNLLHAAQTSHQTSKPASVDRALASLAENSAVSSWDDSLDDALLLSLVGV
jgi:hypothetical protein